MQIFIGFVIGMFIGTLGGFFICALAVVASKDDRNRERDTEIMKNKEERTHDGTGISKTGNENL